MNATDSLDAIWQSYQTTIACLRISTRAVKNGNIAAIEKTSLLHDPVDEALRKIEKSREIADDNVILSLWTVFERALLLHLQNESKILLTAPHSKMIPVFQKKIEDVEYWRIDEVLDIFKFAIDPTLIGSAKQIKKYRDWVAHKNPKKGRPQNVPPQIAYQILSEISKQLNHLAQGNAP
jgi:hypothetical protein